MKFDEITVCVEAWVDPDLDLGVGAGVRFDLCGEALRDGHSLWGISIRVFAAAMLAV